MSLSQSTLRGALTMALGFLLLGVQPVFVKLAGQHGFTTAETVIIRFAIALLLLVVVARATRQSLRTHNPKLWALRGILGGIAVLLYFESVRLAGAGMGTLLNYTYPVWANLFSFTIGERPRRLTWVALAMALCGAYLVVNPSAGGLGRGELFGLLSGLLAGGAIVCIRKLRQTDGELTIIASFSSVGIVFALPFAWGGRGVVAATPDATGWWAEALVGLLSFFGHMYFTRGYKETSIQLGTVLSFMVPVLAALSGYFVLGEPLTLGFVVGAALIGLSFFALAYREAR